MLGKSFIDNVNKKLFLYVQTFAAKKCILTVYKDNKLRKIICGKTPADQIFEYHLKKQIISDVNWMGFIENWKNQQNLNII
ncbi:hypothetical protein GLOIN_2v1791345 [Rhizophagus irregularis DAOM 181602=DAOM 197198]|nr:hypothetical protein GLOIN_2v1791345 [Rhizophagus irregularis DAOM 181602=DAOM 197198]